MITIICNPIAGGGRSVPIMEKLDQYLKDQGIEHQMQVSNYAGHTLELVRQAVERGDEGIYTLGGDGTIYEAVNAAQGLENVPPLGFLPGGTGNDFTRSLGISRDPVQAMDQLLHGRPVEIDLWQTDKGVFFSNVVGLGLDIDLVDNAVRTKKIFKGLTAYVAALLLTLVHFKYKHIRLTVDGQVYEREVIVITCDNGIYYGGGILVAPRADITDGKLDIIIINKVPKFKIPFILGEYIKGKHVNKPYCEYLQGSDITIESLDDPLVYENDGEAQYYTPVHIWTAGKQRTLAPADFKVGA